MTESIILLLPQTRDLEFLYRISTIPSSILMNDWESGATFVPNTGLKVSVSYLHHPVFKFNEWLTVWQAIHTIILANISQTNLTCEKFEQVYILTFRHGVFCNKWKTNGGHLKDKMLLQLRKKMKKKEKNLLISVVCSVPVAATYSVLRMFLIKDHNGRYSRLQSSMVK